MNPHKARATNHDPRPPPPPPPPPPPARRRRGAGATPVFGTFSSTAILARTRKRAAGRVIWRCSIPLCPRAEINRDPAAPERELRPCGGQLDHDRVVIYYKYLCAKCRNAR